LKTERKNCDDGRNQYGTAAIIHGAPWRLDDDKAAVSADMKEVFAEAKSEGYDAKIMRKVLKLIKQDKAKRQEEQTLVDLYLQSVEG